MSVGGKVIEVIDCGSKLWVNTEDHGHECAVYVERNAASLNIQPRDSLWWQGRDAYWTPKHRAVKMPYFDHAIPRIGFSGVSRPAVSAGAERKEKA